jgi:hypothetical protein
VDRNRKWSWLIKRGQFIFPNQVTVGTVSVTNGLNTVTGVGTTFTQTMVGQQFRIGLLYPIYDIISVQNSTHLTLSDVWGGLTSVNVGYQIYTAYQPAPLDFHSFTSVYDPNFSWQLWFSIAQDELNLYDAQRSSQGTPYVVADYDYTSLQLGGATITPPIPRFEIWPHQVSAYVIPYIYESRPPDLDDAGATLPRYIRGDILLEGALAQAALWPGTDSEHRNPYFNMDVYRNHSARFERMVQEMAVQDDEVYGRDLWYTTNPTWPMAPYPFPVNASFLQVHAF